MKTSQKSPAATKKSTENNAKKFIDLFCGIGGFRSALEDLGHECVFSSEIDPLAASAYEMNFGERPSGDITKISVKDIPQHDILCAGFPCQPYSSAGGRKGEEDERGKLFHEIVRIVAHCKPRALILENVPALQTIHGGKTFRTILSRLDALGYEVHAEVLHAAQFGVPQARKRLFIVAVLRDSGTSYTPPVPTAEQAPLSTILDEKSDGAVVLREDLVLRVAKTAKPHAPVSVGLVGPKGRQGYRIYSPAGPAVTLTANGGGPGGQTGLYLVDGVLRRLSQREAKRAMGFPDSHVVTPGRAGFKQLGNSVCPPVVAAIAKGLRFNDGYAKKEAPKARAGRRASAPNGGKVGVPDGTVGSCEYPTPDWLALPLVEKFNLETDVCANPANAKCARYYTAQDDGLSQEWTGKIWMNPPYGRGIQKWIEKAWRSVTEGEAEVVVCLIPVSPGTKYWHRYVLRSNCDVVFLEGRVRFVGAKKSPAFDSAVVVMRRPGTEPYDVREIKRMLDASKAAKRWEWKAETPPSFDTAPIGMNRNPVSKKPVTDGMNESPRNTKPAIEPSLIEGGAR